MNVVLVVEPNSSQASALRREIQRRVSAELILVDSTAAALTAIKRRVPDLILLSALLSPRDEASLVSHLRSLDGASHLQTLTIPQLRVGRKPAKSGKGGFGFRKKQKAPVEVGCDPGDFAEEIVAHLSRAAEIRNRPPSVSPVKRAHKSAAPEPEAPVLPVTEFPPIAEFAPVEAVPEFFADAASAEAVSEPIAERAYEPVFESVFDADTATPPYMAQPAAIVEQPFVMAEEPPRVIVEAPPRAMFADSVFHLRDEVEPLRVIAEEPLPTIAEAPPISIAAKPVVFARSEPKRSASDEDEISRLVRTLGLKTSAFAIDAIEEETPEVVQELPAPEVEADEVAVDMLAELRIAEAEAEAKLNAELDRVRAEADAQRMAELARVQAEADATRDLAIADARAAAEREARETLAAELARVRSEAEGTFTEALNKVKVEAEQAERLRMDAQENFAADLARVRAEVEQTLGAQLDAARLEAERVRAAEAELARVQAEAEGARLRVEAEAARVRAEADARMSAELERMREEAERARLAEQSKAQQATEQIKEAAILEARAIAEASARRTLEAEITRVRREADALLEAELSRTRAEAEERQSAELEELRAQMAEMRQAAAEHARAAAAEAVAAEVARATAQSQEKPAPRPTAVIARFPTAVREDEFEPDTDETEEVQPHLAALAAEVAHEVTEGRRDYYSLWAPPPPVVEETVEAEPEEPPAQKSERGEIFETFDEPRSEHLRRHAKWALPIAACLLLVTNTGTAISTVARFVTKPEEPIPSTIVEEKAPEPTVKIVDRNVGDLRIESTPAGADVKIDGKSYGRTPVTVPGLRAGAHTLSLRSSAGTLVKRITIKPGETLVASEAIFSGWLAIFSPIPIVVSLDGRKVQSTDDGRIMLAPGTYNVEMYSERFNYRETKQLVVRPGGVTAHTLSLPNAAVHVRAPDGAEVRVDNEVVGRTPMTEFKVPIGSREITVVHPERGVRRASVDVRYGQPTQVNLRFD